MVYFPHFTSLQFIFKFFTFDRYLIFKGIATMFCLRKFARNYAQLDSRMISFFGFNGFKPKPNDDPIAVLKEAKDKIYDGDLYGGGIEGSLAINIALQNVAKQQNFILKDDNAKVEFNAFIASQSQSEKKRRELVINFGLGRLLHSSNYYGDMNEKDYLFIISLIEKHIEYLNSYEFDQTQADAFAKEYKTLCWSDGKGNINVGEEPEGAE